MKTVVVKGQGVVTNDIQERIDGLEGRIVTRHNLQGLGWEELMRPPYSSDLEPNDCQLLISIANDLAGRKPEKIDCPSFPIPIGTRILVTEA